MKIETLLPLGKVDPGLRAPDQPLDVGKVADQARLVESLGYDGLMTEETKDDPFVIMALAAHATTTLNVGTAVAIAFPRSPTSMALSAWTIQRLSRGRFTLGLGPQVRAHIERRYGMQAHPAGPWMREYVKAVRAVWDCWQNGTQLNVTGEYYNINLMVPLFNPGPIEHPWIPIHLAAVNTVMCKVAGEVADGIRPHPVCTPSYIEQVMLPAVRLGAKNSGRSLENFSVSMKPLVASAPDEEQLQPKIRDARARIAFYASTPAYSAAFEHLGLHDLAAEAKLLSRAQRWEDLPRLVSDEILDQFAVIGTYDKIGRKLVERFGHVVTNTEFSISVRDEQERKTLAALVRDVKADSTDRARANILGDVANSGKRTDA
ncbi:MAG: TIGR03617 family F420-dependent LLM class oxidoreductase [Burkholderiaceae bacterium]|nr:TIGR03617 family F420-dependent LLM class oxidoreductase [Burkholderiaceae bacterium]